MAIGRITKRTVESLPAGSVLWDDHLPGFGVRRVKRTAVYCLKYRFNRRPRWFAIGPHGRPWTPDLARKEALRLLTMIRVERRDPAADRDAIRTEATFAEFSQRFLDEYATRKVKARTLAEYKRQLEKHLKPEWGSLRVSAITRVDVEKLHASLTGKPIQANRIINNLRTMFSVAEQWGLIARGSNPTRHIQRYKENKRDRLITPTELGRLGDALTRAEKGWTDAEWEALPIDARPTRQAPEDPRAIAAVRLLAFTGARRGEILSLTWGSIDLERGIARLEDSKTGARNLVLSAAAVGILKELPRQKGNPYVLPGEREGQHFIGVVKPWERIRKAAGLTGVRLHDLRHCFASTAVGAGESLYTTGKLLGHRVPVTTQRYAHLAPDPIKGVADRTADTIAAAMAGASDE